MLPKHTKDNGVWVIYGSQKVWLPFTGYKKNIHLSRTQVRKAIAKAKATAAFDGGRNIQVTIQGKQTGRHYRLSI